MSSPFNMPKVVEKEMSKARPMAPVVNLTMTGLSPEARDGLEKALVAASKSGRFMISVFQLEIVKDNPMLVLNSYSVKTDAFPVAEFNLCQDHFHQHLATMSIEKPADPTAPLELAPLEGV